MQWTLIAFATMTIQKSGLLHAEELQPDDRLPRVLQIRSEIEDRGVVPFATFVGEGWANVHGGVDQGAWYNHLLDFGVELDTARLNWWEGGLFVVQFHWVSHAGKGSCFEDRTGVFNPVSNISAKDHFRIYNLYYAHEWRDGAVSLKLGQIAADDDFMVSDYSSLFLNSAFGAMPSQVGTPLASSCGNFSGFPIYSIAAPGLFLRVNPVERFSSQIGLYHGRIGADASDNHGFDWASESPFELGLFWENAIQHDALNRPGTLRLGLSYHTGPRDDFSCDEPNSETSQRCPDFYVIHDWALLNTAEGNPKLGWFCRAGGASEPDCSVVDFYADTGLNWFAPFPVRDADVAGIAISYTRFSNAYRKREAGGSRDETTIELTYQAEIKPWFILQADTQLLFNPGIDPGTGDRRTAVILGLRGVASF